MILSNTRLIQCGLLTVLGLGSLLLWRALSPEARGRRDQAPAHVHTVTFTCTRTCTDLHQIPEVFPWH